MKFDKPAGRNPIDRLRVLGTPVSRVLAAAIANALCHATGVRVREYPITLDKLLAHLPAQA